MKGQVLLAATLLFSSTQVAVSCAAINEAVVEVEEFSFGYSSWVEAPIDGSQLFKYSRCVRSLNGSWFDFDWVGAGLKGRVKTDQPVFVQYVFFRELTLLSQGELKFGRSKPLENRILANFIMNEAEAGGFAMVDAYIDELTVLNVAALQAGSTLAENITAISTAVSISVPINDDIDARLDLTFTSSIRGFIDESVSQYEVSFIFDPDQVAGDNVVTLAPRSDILAELFLKNRDSTQLFSSVEQQVWPLTSPFFTGVGDIPSLTAVSDIVDIKVNDVAVASFPVTFYSVRFQ
jgi:hypothetical protein